MGSIEIAAKTQSAACPTEKITFAGTRPPRRIHPYFRPNQMSAQAKFLIRLSAFWLILFAFSRAFFVVLQWEIASIFSYKELFYSFLYGLKMDISATGYLVILPIFSGALAPWISESGIRTLAKWFSLPLVAFVLLLTVADAGLYRFWGFRLDSTPLFYLKNPAEAFASVSATQLIIFVTTWILLFNAWGWLFFRLTGVGKPFAGRSTWRSSWVYILASGLLIIPIRGGTGVSTMNLGSVYFHKDTFPNHAAINVGWNLVYSLTKNSKLENYSFLETEKAKQLIQKTQQKPIENQLEIAQDTPDILVIILESFTAKVIGSCGGKGGITPEFDRYAREGWLFPNCYASGDRSDKGLVSILSGFPAQPNTSVIKYPGKTQKLPFVNLILKRSGYSSSFYYGGDINFASMKSYFVNGKYDRIVSVDDFPSNENTARWGVPDHVAFAKLWEDVHVSPSPFFKVLFTLSSHEPFDIPVTPSFGAGTEEKRFLSAIRYTDACLGSFLDSLKQSPRWKRTLVLLVADHGSRLPGNSQVYEPDKFRIPLLITGGALKSGPRVLPEIVSQTDIPATLLGLLNLPTADFPFSQNLARQAPDRAFYAFNNGFGLIAGHGVLVYDLPGRHAIAGNEALTPDLLQKGQAFLQEVSEWMETH